MEGLLVGGRGELVPGADRQAVVAAVDPVAHGLAVAPWHGAVMLDGQVGEAGARVELERRGEGLGRADVQAGPAGAAMLAGGRVRGEGEVGEHRSQEQP